MSIMELGSLGDFLASLAVFVTLVLLILQFRSARREISTQVTREIKRHNNDTFHQLTQDPALMDVHVRGQRNFEALTEQEKLRWMVWMFTWITQTEDGYVARRTGIPDMTWVDRYLLGVASVMRSPGGGVVWPKMRGWFDEVSSGVEYGRSRTSTGILACRVVWIGAFFWRQSQGAASWTDSLSKIRCLRHMRAPPR